MLKIKRLRMEKMIVNGFEIFRDDSHFGMFVVRKEGTFSDALSRRFMSLPEAIKCAEGGMDDGVEQEELEL